jgi:hypothetical protein
MTAISLAYAARRSRLGRTAATAIVATGRISRDSGRDVVEPAWLRDRFAAGNVASRSREFAGGFVDFLLGRGACHPR